MVQQAFHKVKITDQTSVYENNFINILHSGTKSYVTPIGPSFRVVKSLVIGNTLQILQTTTN